jgi:uridine kinase
MILGISGCTNGGKTTLCKLLFEAFPNSVYLNQDKYFHSKESGLLEFRSELGSFNYETLEAIDSTSFLAEFAELKRKQASKYETIILDGFLIFAYDSISFDKKYFFTLSKEACLQRRLNRKYKTVGTIEYFESLVWPSYMQYYTYCKKKFNDIVYLDGEMSIELIAQQVKIEIMEMLAKEKINRDTQEAISNINK